jgi:predicted RNA-binding Zn ribbon-like protein
MIELEIPQPMKKTNSEKRPPQFELIAGSLCLDFINTLDNRPSGEPRELLTDFSDLARFGEESGILTPQQADFFFHKVRRRSNEAEAALRRARKLREALHAIFSALMNGQNAPQIAMDTLNANLQDAALHSRLVQHKESCDWRFDDFTSSFNSILWPLARAAADLLASAQLSFVRACSSPTCQWLFLDTSKNHHRRWCSMKLCGNRDKVRKFYARRKNAV